MNYYTNQSYYDVLGIKEDASLENIQRAKDRLKFGNPDDRVPFSMWGKIDEAYNVLSNSEKRKEYDRKLKEEINIYSNSDYDTSSNTEQDTVSDLQGEQEQTQEIDEYENIYSNSDHDTSSNTEQDTEIDLEKEPIETKEQTLEKSEEEKEYDLNFVSEFNPKEKEPKEKTDGSKLKTIAKYVGGTLTGFVVAGPIGAIAVPIWMKKHKKTKLQKTGKSKKITKITTEEMNEIEKYNQNLNTEINRLLSEPHNNYKLEINRIKYENQITLLEALLDIKLSKKVKRTEMLKQKLDVVSTKMQLETAKKNLANIKEKINEYEKEQGLSKVNKELIEVNQKLAEQKDNKSFSIKKLEAYQTKLLNKRDSKAKGIKSIVIKSGKVYDSILKAKDFTISLPYVFKSVDKLDEFMSEEIQKTR